MGKFKNFLINEELGLGELGSKANDLFNSQWFSNQIGGAYTSSDITGSEQFDSPLHLPSTDMTIPSVERTGRITTLLSKRNPIYIRLSDGTEAQFTYDEYKRIKGKPEIGKVMTMFFQRHPEDSGLSYSKIDKAIVKD